jgi:hypothetical protein
MVTIRKITTILLLLSLSNSVYAAEPFGTPVLGGYLIGKYSYSDKADDEASNGFNARLVLMYFDGTLLNDFKYRIQAGLNGTPKLEEYYLEWTRYKTLCIKIGQFKRPFTFENSYSPWSIGLGDFSQSTTKLAGLDDYNGESSMGGRDQGIQLQGELFKVGHDAYPLVQYQLGVFNGQGINRKDANSDKDIIGNIRLQPIKGLFVGASAWNGTFTADDVTVARKRWAVGATYDEAGWVARAEYVHSKGHKINDIQEDGLTTGSGEADGWYALIGVPCKKWLQVFGRYDAYRDQAAWNSLKTIYSVCPNFQLHKNLVFQLQYNNVCDKASARRPYQEFWLEVYARF